MTNPITWIKLQYEGFMFGVKRGREMAVTNPFMPMQERQIRVVLEWGEHLLATGREKFVKKDQLAKLKNALKRHDENKKAVTEFKVFDQMVEDLMDRPQSYGN